MNNFPFLLSRFSLHYPKSGSNRFRLLIVAFKLMLYLWRSLIFLLIFISMLSCQNKKNSHRDNHQPIIVVELKSQNIDLDSNSVYISLRVKSFMDSIFIEKLMIEHPSYLVPISDRTIASFRLNSGDAKTNIIKYKLASKESFKVTGVVIASSTTRRDLRISEVNHLYYYYDEHQYLISNDINDFLGKKRGNGIPIKNEDLRIFNRAEIENLKTN